jgi:hypothetical protein
MIFLFSAIVEVMMKVEMSVKGEGFCRPAARVMKAQYIDLGQGRNLEVGQDLEVDREVVLEVGQSAEVGQDQLVGQGE